MCTQAAQIHLFQCVPELIPSLKAHRQGCSVGLAPMITARPEKVGKKPLAGRSHPFLPGLTQAGGTATQPHSSKLSFKMLKKETPFLPPSLLFLLSPSLVLLTRAEAVGYICTSTPPLSTPLRLSTPQGSTVSGTRDTEMCRDGAGGARVQRHKSRCCERGKEKCGLPCRKHGQKTQGNYPALLSALSPVEYLSAREQDPFPPSLVAWEKHCLLAAGLQTLLDTCISLPCWVRQSRLVPSQTQRTINTFAVYFAVLVVCVWPWLCPSFLSITVLILTCCIRIHALRSRFLLEVCLEQSIYFYHSLPSESQHCCAQGRIGSKGLSLSLQDS